MNSKGDRTTEEKNQISVDVKTNSRLLIVFFKPTLTDCHFCKQLTKNMDIEISTFLICTISYDLFDDGTMITFDVPH